VRFLITSFVVALLCLGLNGCSTLPERDPVQSAAGVPQQWSDTQVSAGTLAEHWLDAFADPRLSAVVNEALAANYDLKSAAARVDAARAEARIAGAGLWPQVALAAGYERARVSDTGFGASGYGAFEALFSLTWELDVWGRLRAARDAARQNADAAEADFRAARLSLAARTAQVYFELAEARLQAQVAEDSIRERRTIVELVRGRFARGLTRGLDVRLALTDLVNAEAQLAQARNQVQSATRRLEVLLGRYPAGALAGEQILPDPPAALSAGLPAALLERRPDLAAAFERLRAADSRLDSARKALLPRIALTAEGGTRSPALTELADPRAAIWHLAMGLLQPIFTGGRLKGEISLSEARVEEALNRYRDTALNAFREVEQALAAEERLREQERALREAVRQTQESRKLAVYSYRHGLIEILTLLDSYRSTLSAQSAHLAVRRLLLSNRIDLYLALGGSF
jgi:multidrug efflux system outer membrane protein